MAGANEYRMTRRVRDLPQSLQPRELLDRQGAEKVSESVLVAILLRSGVQGLSVVDLADGLVLHYGNLTNMARASVEELSRHHGMGKVKAQVLKSALELGRRLTAECVEERPSVRTPEQVAALLKEDARVLDQEVLWLLMLDTKYRLLRPPEEVSRGILDANLAHPREIFRKAVGHAAAAVILAHNHPSGDTTPSAEDIRITKQMVEAGRLMDIDVLDHVILGCPSGNDRKAFFSLRESGMVDFG